MILLSGMTAIPDQIRFKGYYEATCEITLKDGSVRLLECVVHRPSNRRNFAGDRIIDWLALVVETELTEAELSGTAIGIARYGGEISEQEAIAKAGRYEGRLNAGGDA